MPRPSRPPRTARQGSLHGTKRATMKGNNKFGSKGCMKCDECRRRKTRCEYDETKPHEPCKDCKKRGYPCGKAFPQQTNGRSEYSISSLSPTPSDVSTPITEPFPCDSGHIEVETAPPVAVQSMTHKLHLLACDLEATTPRIPTSGIIAQLHDMLERGDCGVLGAILHPTTTSVSQGHISHPPTQFYPRVYPTYHHLGYPQHIIPQLPQHSYISTTINPASLTSFMDTSPYAFSTDYVDGDSDSTGPDVDYGTSYTYVSHLGVLHV